MTTRRRRSSGRPDVAAPNAGSSAAAFGSTPEKSGWHPPAKPIAEVRADQQRGRPAFRLQPRNAESEHRRAHARPDRAHALSSAAPSPALARKGRRGGGSPHAKAARRATRIRCRQASLLPPTPSACAPRRRTYAPRAAAGCATCSRPASRSCSAGSTRACTRPPSATTSRGPATASGRRSTTPASRIACSTRRRTVPSSATASASRTSWRARPPRPTSSRRTRSRRARGGSPRSCAG